MKGFKHNLTFENCSNVYFEINLFLCFLVPGHFFREGICQLPDQILCCAVNLNFCVNRASVVLYLAVESSNCSPGELYEKVSFSSFWSYHEG